MAKRKSKNIVTTPTTTVVHWEVGYCTSLVPWGEEREEFDSLIEAEARRKVLKLTYYYVVIRKISVITETVVEYGIK